MTRLLIILSAIVLFASAGCDPSVCSYSVQEWQDAYGSSDRRFDLDDSGVVDGADFELRADRCDG